MVEEVLELKETVRVGNILGVFTVLVQIPLDPSALFNIQKVLMAHGVSVYDIYPIDGIKELCHSCAVGSKISYAETFGTVGGFAERIADGQKYILLAGHVANCVLQKDMVVYLNGKEVSIDQEDIYRCKSPMDDITTCVVNRDIEAKFHLDGRFMTEEGSYKPCLIPDYHSSACAMTESDSGDIGILEGAEVYIRGAKTDLGLGKIVSVNMFGRDVPPLIFIEDLEKDKHFCLPGDSGALVCYNDADASHIQAIAMVQGEFHSRFDSEKQFQRYSAIELGKGIDRIALHLGKMSLFDKEFGTS